MSRKKKTDVHDNGTVAVLTENETAAEVVAQTAEAPVETPQEPAPRRPVMCFGPYPVDAKGTSIKVSIWDKEITLQDERKITVYSAVLQKSYLDQNGQWQTTQNLRGSEIPIAVHALQKAHDWILEARNGSTPF